MNKEGFILELVKQTNRSKEECILISDSLEDNFLIGKKNKEKTINILVERLNISVEEADEIYNISSSIIAQAIKDKLKHPFKSKD